MQFSGDNAGYSRNSCAHEPMEVKVLAEIAEELCDCVCGRPAGTQRPVMPAIPSA
jgi:hypothetical protein